MYPLVLNAQSTVPTDEAQNLSVTPGLGDLFQMLGSLGLVVIIIFALSYVLRRVRFANNPNSSHLRVISSLNVGPRDRLLLVQTGEEQFVVGVSSSGMQKIHELSEPLTVSETHVSSRFAQTIGALSGTKHG